MSTQQERSASEEEVEIQRIIDGAAARYMDKNNCNAVEPFMLAAAICLEALEEARDKSDKNLNEVMDQLFAACIIASDSSFTIMRIAGEILHVPREVTGLAATLQKMGANVQIIAIPRGEDKKDGDVN